MKIITKSLTVTNLIGNKTNSIGHIEEKSKDQDSSAGSYRIKVHHHVKLFNKLEIILVKKNFAEGIWKLTNSFSFFHWKLKTKRNKRKNCSEIARN